MMRSTFATAALALLLAACADEVPPVAATPPAPPQPITAIEVLQYAKAQREAALS